MLKIDEETERLWARRKRKERIKSVLGCIAAFFATLLYATILWLFLASTPSQFSAEAEACAEELGK